MLSKKWQDYHLTENGWVKGFFNIDIQRKTLAIPLNTKLTHRYYEVMDRKLQYKNLYKDTYNNAEVQKKLLVRHPYPKPEFKRYRLEQ